DQVDAVGDEGGAQGGIRVARAVASLAQDDVGQNEGSGGEPHEEIGGRLALGTLGGEQAEEGGEEVAHGEGQEAEQRRQDESGADDVSCLARATRGHFAGDVELEEAEDAGGEAQQGEGGGSAEADRGEV